LFEHIYRWISVLKTMKKYKISKHNLKEFFGLFGGTKKKPQSMQDLIDNDPVLKKLEKELGDINKKAAERIKRTDPDFADLLRKHNIDID
jgi:hypothetical protein